MDAGRRLAECEELLSDYQDNRHRLEKRFAYYGGMIFAPLEDQSRYTEIEKQIKILVEEIRTLKVDKPVSADTGSTLQRVQIEPKPVPPAVRVFISSTMRDLQAERKCVEDALTALDLKAVRAESIGAQSASPYEASLAMAQECDIYLGIYGGRYGSIVPGDGRSITEIEYQTAQKLKRPILIYRKTGVALEAEQEEFLRFAGDMVEGHCWREFGPDDVPGNVAAWVQADVRAEVARHPEWRDRAPVRDRVLLASLGRSPGAVTGMYQALVRAGKRPGKVITFSPCDRDVREAAGICEEEFHGLGVPYEKRFSDAEDIESEGDAREYKSAFYAALQGALSSGAEVLVGITGGRTVMGALMTVVVQTTAPREVELYHLAVDHDIEKDGQLPDMWRHQYTPRWQELLNPPAAKARLVRVPMVRFPGVAGAGDPPAQA